jgi:hypothetical protein
MKLGALKLVDFDRKQTFAALSEVQPVIPVWVNAIHASVGKKDE